MSIIKVKTVRFIRVNIAIYILLAIIALFTGFAIGQMRQTATLEAKIAVMQLEQEYIQAQIKGQALHPESIIAVETVHVNDDLRI